MLKLHLSTLLLLLLLFLEGFTSQYGGLSTSSKLTANQYGTSTSAYKAANALAAGYGFGTAVFFFAFILVS
jgi:hypothetical protein